MTAVREDRPAAMASAAVGILSAVALAVGMLLMSKLGGTSGRTLGEGASILLFREASGLLLLAESIKLASAAALAFVVHRTARSAAGKWSLLVTGMGAALLGAAGGLVGAWAVLGEAAELGETTSAIGFYGLAATGLWVLAMIAAGPVALGRWPRIAGILFAVSCLAALVAPPVALLSVVLGWAWWFGLAAKLRRSA